MPVDREDPGLVAFTEPNLAFSVAACSGERTRLRVRFSLEALPAWLGGDDAPEHGEFFIDLDLETAALAVAAEAWEAALAAFPARGVT